MNLARVLFVKLTVYMLYPVSDNYMYVIQNVAWSCTAMKWQSVSALHAYGLHSPSISVMVHCVHRVCRSS